MDSAAMEMRRERQSKRASTYISPEDAPAIDTPDTIPETPEDEEVDWAFWGTVVQGYEQVALARPKELSKAIQQGVPPVIRGAVWQLMSSSKSLDLEEAYKALLKLSSPHEKAIMKDLNRTFPNHKYFKEGGGVGQEGLFMVVKAYSLYAIFSYPIFFADLWTDMIRKLGIPRGWHSSWPLSCSMYARSLPFTIFH